MMKVAVLTQYFPTSQQRWAGHSAYQTLRQLAGLCNLHVFFPEASYPAALTPLSARRPALDRSWSPPDVPVSYIPYNAIPLLSRPFNGASIYRSLCPHIKHFRPDILLNFVAYPDGYAAVRTGRSLRLPVVLMAIGSDLNRIPDPLCRIHTRAALRHADFVTTVSRDLLVTAQSLGADPARSMAILNGCDTAIFYPADKAAARILLSLDPAAEIILYVGRLDLRKGLLELIEATSQLHAQRPGLLCYLVGEGPARPALLEAIARHNAGSYITLVPACPTDQVARWMAAANLVTLPSYKEGCPNVVVEALAAGRPVVATHTGGIPELVDDSCGRLIPAKDVPALRNALDEALNLPWDAKTIAGRHNRSWLDVAHTLYEILELTLATHV